jgi:hypothetical protein
MKFYRTLSAGLLFSLSPLAFSDVEFTETMSTTKDSTNVQICMDLVETPDAFPVTVDLVAVRADTFLSDEAIDSNALEELGDNDKFEFQIVFNSGDTNQCYSLTRSEVTASNPILAIVTDVTNSQYVKDVRFYAAAAVDDLRPELSLNYQQGTGDSVVSSRVISKTQGDVVMTAQITDPEAEAYTISWVLTDNRLVDTDSDDNTFTFDPSSLENDEYTVSYGILQPGSIFSSDTLVISETIRIQDETVTSDSDLDGVTDLQEGGAVLDLLVSDGQVYAEVQNGLEVRLGDIEFALGQSTPQVNFSEYEALVGDILDGDETSSTLLSLDILGLDVVNGQAKVVVKLSSPLVANAAFINFRPDEEDEDDRLEAYYTRNLAKDSYFSGQSVDGDCPPINEDNYSTNTTIGDDCLLLKITDGSVNDEDGLANGRISILGLLGESRDIFATVGDTDEDDGEGSVKKMGPGSFNLFFIFSMFAMLALRYSSKAKV